MNDNEKDELIKELREKIKELERWKELTTDKVREGLNIVLAIPGVVPQDLDKEDE